MLNSTPTLHDKDPANDSDADADADADAETETETAILQSSILVVDDQAAHVHLLERMLRDFGYTHVSSTMDPRQVGAQHRKHDYDLILLDLQMPILDGFGVMDEVRALARSNCLPVIALTAQPAHKLRALQAGARDFINKPFEAVEVKVRIHHMLEVRWLQKRLELHNRELERRVQERTAELEVSEARYRSLTELAVDWYWEQNETGTFTRGSGPVKDLLGIADGALHAENDQAEGLPFAIEHWDRTERQKLRDNIQQRRPFLDLVMHRRRADGSKQQFKISGEPMFDRTCRFTGFRGVGVEVLSHT
jgi:DNA-binding response OmpR family regulator